MTVPEQPIESERTMQIHFVKSPDFRAVYAEGAWGGLTPTLFVRMSFYTHYREIPEAIHYRVESENRLVETGRTGSQRMIREVQADVTMPLEAARSLRDWLSTRLDEADSMKADPRTHTIVD